MKIKLATRQSELALFQANYVMNKIQIQHTEIEVELVPMTSEGDQTEKPLHEIGGKGLFVTKLESALETGEADIAVHSLKDVPAKIDMKYSIAAIFEREDPSDVLLSRNGSSLADFSSNASIGTSSPRRKAQILRARTDLNIIPVRGNIATRIRKLHEGHFDGLIVAKAALNRLNIELTNAYEFSMQEMLPAASQGFIGVECLKSNKEIISIMSSINNSSEMALANAEREFVASLNGSCLSPIAILCKEDVYGINISAKVLSQNGQKEIYREIKSSHENLTKDIHSLADDFISNDAHLIILE